MNYHLRIKKLFFLALYSFLYIITFTLQAQEAQVANVLFSIDSVEVTVEEFAYHYFKRNNDSVPSIEHLEDYMQRFIDFKLKVSQAYQEQQDTSIDFQKDIAEFNKKLEDSYIFSHQVTPELLQEAYERSKTEVHAAHILIECSPIDAPEDTLQAYEKIVAIKKEISEGLSFDKAAKQYSEGPSATFGGDLGYFSVFKMVYEFESAAYNTSVGGVSEIIRTDFGYHLLYIKDKRSTQASAYHDIYDQNLNQKVLDDSRSRINDDSLVNFLKMENHYILNDKNRAKIFKKLDEQLQEGTWSPSPMLLKKWRKKPLFLINNRPYTCESFLLFIKDHPQRFPENFTLDKIREKYFRLFEQISLVEYQREHLVEKFPVVQWELKEYEEGSLFFTMMEEHIWNPENTTPQKLKKYYTDHAESYSSPPSAHVKIYNAGSKEVLTKVQNAIDKGNFEVHPSDVMALGFRRNGYGFSSRDRRDINKIARLLKTDSSLSVKLTADKFYFEKSWAAPKRLEAIENQLKRYGVRSSQILKSEIQTKRPYSKRYGGKVHFQYYNKHLSLLEEYINNENPGALHIQDSVFIKDQSPVLHEIPWEEGVYTKQFQDRFYWIHFLQISPPKTRPFEEVKLQVIQDYQTFLENNWVDSLRKDASIMIHKEQLPKVLLLHRNVNNRLR